MDELVHEVQFVGVERPGHEKKTPYPVLWITAPKMDISSTQIRKNVLFNKVLNIWYQNCGSLYRRKGVVFRMSEVQSFEPYTTMTREELLSHVQSNMGDKRYQHCLRVERKILELQNFTASMKKKQLRLWD